MNEQVLSFIRTLVQSGASALAAKGLTDQQRATIVVAFVMWLIPTVLGLYVRRKAGLVASAAALPDPTVTSRHADTAAPGAFAYASSRTD